MQPEVLEVAIAKAAAIEHLDFEINAFGKTIAVAAIEVVQNALPPVVERSDKGLQGTQTSRFGLGLPFAQLVGGGLAIGRFSKLGPEGLFQFVAGLEFLRYGEHLRQALDFFGGQVFAILDQQPAATFEDGLGRLIRLSLNGTPGFSDSIVEVLHDMKAVHDALGLRE